jgi:hypothetical protein
MRGLTWKNTDGRFALTLSTMGQLLYTFRHNATAAPTARTFEQSFQLRRARLFLSGNAFSKHFKYSLQLQFAPADLGLDRDGTIRQSPVFWSFISYDKVRDLTPQLGFFFVPFSRQRMEPPWKLQLIDSSMAAYEFGFDRDVGLELRSMDLGGVDTLRYHVGVFMGEGYDFATPRDFGFLYVARVEVLPLGSFDDYAEADFVRTIRPKLAIGAAYAFNDNDFRRQPLGDGPADGGTTDTHTATADLHFKFAGFSLLGDFFWRQGKRNPGVATMLDAMDNEVPVPIEAARSGLGWTAQAGYLVPRSYFEFAGRYSALHPLGDADTSLPRADEYGPGLGYYFVQHALKLQVDYVQQRLGQGATVDRLRLQVTFFL